MAESERYRDPYDAVWRTGDHQGEPLLNKVDYEARPALIPLSTGTDAGSLLTRAADLINDRGD